jgi:structural maintenance of chromosome 1
VSIELYNFKSFSYHEGKDIKPLIVGPFTEITGILGPNGVGKSNIFDAIAFALGLKFQKGRNKNIDDLAHRI